jgi:hypothetical protein
MQFSNATWLWALTGLFIPIGIHLLSRKEGKVILIGSLRYLRESPTAQFRHIKLNEIILLVLRCVMVILLVLWLAGMKLNVNEQKNKKWVVIEKGIERSKQYGTFIDSPRLRGFEVRWLSSGFPVLADSAALQSVDNYWALAEALASLELDSAAVISYNFQSRFRGERIALPEHIRWLTQDPENNIFAAQMIADGDSLFIREGSSSRTLTSFETVRVKRDDVNDTSLIEEKKQIDIVIFFSPDFDYDRKIVEAALKSIDAITPHSLNISARPSTEWRDQDMDWTIWLSTDSIPWKDAREAIVFRTCAIKTGLLLPPGSPACNQTGIHSWLITKRLNQETAVKEHFTLDLASMILPSPPEIDRDNDRRVLSEKLAWSAGNQKQLAVVSKEALRDIDHLIMILMLLTLVAERWLAFKRNQ